MKPFLIVYATREGQARKVAEHIATTLRTDGYEADVVDAARPPSILDISRYAGVMLTASVHLGKHERAMRNFVKEHHVTLNLLPTAFLSVSLTEATAEDHTISFEHRAAAAKLVKQLMDNFFHETGLNPAHAYAVAGALLYRQYGAMTRFSMRMMSRSNGGDQDTTRDHEYTDWDGLDRFVRSMMMEIAGAQPAAV